MNIGELEDTKIHVNFPTTGWGKLILAKIKYHVTISPESLSRLLRNADKLYSGAEGTIRSERLPPPSALYLKT